MPGIGKGMFPNGVGGAFSVGLLNKEQIHGVYIGSSPEGGKVCAPLLRKKVQIGELATTFLYVNSLGYHEVYVNGKKVTENVLTLQSLN